MTGDRLIRPCIGTAAGVPYVALPPTAVDADPDGPVRVVAAWHGFDPPRTETAFSAALPMTGLPAWRVYLRLPMPVGWPPPGRADRDACTLAARQAAEVFPAALDELRADLAIEPGPIGLVGMAAGAMAALLTLADRAVPVAAAALIAPPVMPQPEPADDRAGDRADDPAETWISELIGRPVDDPAEEQAARLDFLARASDIAGNDTALMLVSGTDDDVVTTADITRFRDLLRGAGMRRVEVATFRMRHELATEPGTDPEPPTAEAVSVDGALTEWFRAQLGVRPRPVADSAGADDADGAGDADDPAGSQPPGRRTEAAVPG